MLNLKLETLEEYMTYFQIFIILLVLIILLILAKTVWNTLFNTLVKPPDVMTEEELMELGLNRLQAKQELRKQRKELREHSNSLNQSVRTSNQLLKTFLNITKKLN